MSLVRAELLKIRTTSVWWIFGVVMLPLWALSVLYNWAVSSLVAQPGVAQAGAGGGGTLQERQVAAAAKAVNVAADLYTSGQFLGVLIVMLLAAILVTSEFFHQTATTTFLVTPARERVVLAKVAASVLLGLLFWLVTTALNLIVVPLVLRGLHVGSHLGDPAIWRAIGLNGVAFGLWAVLGVGAGVLIRSQLAAAITLTVSYLIGTFAAGVAFQLLAVHVAEWLSKLQVLVPTAASQLMVAGAELPGDPPRWVGAVVLAAYAVVMGCVGTAITRRRDVS
jgi:ABC-2 type transport system permease protein